MEVAGEPKVLAQVEAEARAGGFRTRRSGTTIAVLDAERLDGQPWAEGERRAPTLEDVFVVLTGEELG
jgi:lipooligosaccharide transport system ATP-binding protein